jgi:hypothetical protein
MTPTLQGGDRIALHFRWLVLLKERSTAVEVHRIIMFSLHSEYV